MKMDRMMGTRGSFGSVPSVKNLVASTVLARRKGVPITAHFRRYHGRPLEPTGQ